MSRTGGSAEPLRLGLSDRVLLQRRRLDRELAEGDLCDGLEDRAGRAGQLADPLTRHELAIALRRVVAGVEQPPPQRPRGGIRRETAADESHARI